MLYIQTGAVWIQEALVLINDQTVDQSRSGSPFQSEASLADRDHRVLYRGEKTLWKTVVMVRLKLTHRCVCVQRCARERERRGGGSGLCFPSRLCFFLKNTLLLLLLYFHVSIHTHVFFSSFSSACPIQVSGGWSGGAYSYSYHSAQRWITHT